MRNNKTNKILVISPKPDTFLEYFKKIWDYKNLIWVFAQRDIKVKYAQTMLGITWTILQPLTALVIYTVFFGVILNLMFLTDVSTEFSITNCSPFSFVCFDFFSNDLFFL